MRHLPPPPLALLLTLVTSLVLCLGQIACAPLAAPNPAGSAGEGGAPLDRSPPAPTSFSSVEDARGLAWSWDADPSLRVVLTDGIGLIVEHGDASLSMPVDFGDGLVDLPVLLVGPRSDGVEPLAADDGPGLHLLLAGSAEHGCPSDDLELDLLPTPGERGLRLDVAISGVPYLALPADGRLRAVDADGRRFSAAQDLATDGSSVVLDGFTGLLLTGSALGSLRLSAGAPVAWTQLQGHGAFIEVDFDHSCEADPPQTVVELNLTAWL